MLEKRHIEWYWEDVLRARRTALHDIQTARSFAEEKSCQECDYCHYLLRHEEVLARTTADLILLVDSLHEGMRSTYVFPKNWKDNAMIYRGFITDLGEYAPVHDGMDHSQYRKEYEEIHGRERACRMINIRNWNGKAQALFSDRKTSPNKAQYSMLKELMIDAQGALGFFFVFDPTHPH
jgi:hypothetical protein